MFQIELYSANSDYPYSFDYPEKYRKDIAKISEEIKNGIEIRPVSDAEEVLKIALNLSKPEEFMKTRALKVLDGDANLEVAN